MHRCTCFLAVGTSELTEVITLNIRPAVFRMINDLWIQCAVSSRSLYTEKPQWKVVNIWFNLTSNSWNFTWADRLYPRILSGVSTSVCSSFAGGLQETLFSWNGRRDIQTLIPHIWSSKNTGCFISHDTSQYDTTQLYCQLTFTDITDKNASVCCVSMEGL